MEDISEKKDRLLEYRQVEWPVQGFVAVKLFLQVIFNRASCFAHLQNKGVVAVSSETRRLPFKGDGRGRRRRSPMMVKIYGHIFHFPTSVR